MHRSKRSKDGPEGVYLEQPVKAQFRASWNVEAAHRQAPQDPSTPEMQAMMRIAAGSGTRASDMS